MSLFRRVVVTSALDELPRVIDFVSQACETSAVPEDVAFACQLAADEACTNIMEHAYDGRTDGEIRVYCWVSEDQVLCGCVTTARPLIRGSSRRLTWTAT